MGVYTYGTGPITPLPTESGGTAAGNGNLIVPFGIWTAVAIRVQGHWTGVAPPNPATIVGGAFFNNGSQPCGWSNVATNGGTFDTGFQAQGFVTSYNTKQNVGKNSQYNVTIPGTGTTTGTIDSITVQLTGTIPGGAPGEVGPILRLMQIAPNLFFETPIYPPLELQPEAGPVGFPGIDWGPGASTDVFDGFGNLTPAAAKSIFGNDRVRGRKNVACLRRKGGAYINIGGSATQIVPAVMQVSLPGDAQWLKFTPGLANFAASASNGNVGIRVYAGLSRFALGKWTTGYTPIPVAPDWVGNGSFADLFPWERPLQFFVEITGLTTPIPAASLFEFRFDGFDLG